MKLAPAIILLFLIQVSILVFDGVMTENTYTLNPYNAYESNGSIIISNGTSLNVESSNTVYDFIINPTSWGQSAFIIALLASLTTGLAIVVIGTLVGIRSDLVYLSPVFVLLIGFGSIPIQSLYNLLNREVGAFACSTGDPCTTSVLVSGLSAGVLGFYYLMACLAWWSGRPTD